MSWLSLDVKLVVYVKNFSDFAIKQIDHNKRCWNQKDYQGSLGVIWQMQVELRCQ